MDESFTKLNRKQFIKMWRTMKDEAGNRRTSLVGTVNDDVIDIRELMDRYEAKVVLDKVLNKKLWRFWR